MSRRQKQRWCVTMVIMMHTCLCQTTTHLPDQPTPVLPDSTSSSYIQHFTATTSATIIDTPIESTNDVATTITQSTLVNSVITGESASSVFNVNNTTQHDSDTESVPIILEIASQVIPGSASQVIPGSASQVTSKPGSSFLLPTSIVNSDHSIATLGVSKTLEVSSVTMISSTDEVILNSDNGLSVNSLTINIVNSEINTDSPIVHNNTAISNHITEVSIIKSVVSRTHFVQQGLSTHPSSNKTYNTDNLSTVQMDISATSALVTTHPIDMNSGLGNASGSVLNMHSDNRSAPVSDVILATQSQILPLSFTTPVTAIKSTQNENTIITDMIELSSSYGTDQTFDKTISVINETTMHSSYQSYIVSQSSSATNISTANFQTVNNSLHLNESTNVPSTLTELQTEITHPTFMSPQATANYISSDSFINTPDTLNVSHPLTSMAVLDSSAGITDTGVVMNISETSTETITSPFVIYSSTTGVSPPLDNNNTFTLSEDLMNQTAAIANNQTARVNTLPTHTVLMTSSTTIDSETVYLTTSLSDISNSVIFHGNITPTPTGSTEVFNWTSSAAEMLTFTSSNTNTSQPILQSSFSTSNNLTETTYFNTDNYTISSLQTTINVSEGYFNASYSSIFVPETINISGEWTITPITPISIQSQGFTGSSVTTDMSRSTSDPNSLSIHFKSLSQYSSDSVPSEKSLLTSPSVSNIDPTKSFYEPGLGSSVHMVSVDSSTETVSIKDMLSDHLNSSSVLDNTPSALTASYSLLSSTANLQYESSIHTSTIVSTATDIILKSVLLGSQESLSDATISSSDISNLYSKPVSPFSQLGFETSRNKTGSSLLTTSNVMTALDTISLERTQLVPISPTSHFVSDSSGQGSSRSLNIESLLESSYTDISIQSNYNHSITRNPSLPSYTVPTTDAYVSSVENIASDSFTNSLSKVILLSTVSVESSKATLFILNESSWNSEIKSMSETGMFTSTKIDISSLTSNIIHVNTTNSQTQPVPTSFSDVSSMYIHHTPRVYSSSLSMFASSPYVGREATHTFFSMTPSSATTTIDTLSISHTSALISEQSSQSIISSDTELFPSSREILFSETSTTVVRTEPMESLLSSPLLHSTPLNRLSSSLNVISSPISSNTYVWTSISGHATFKMGTSVMDSSMSVYTGLTPLFTEHTSLFTVSNSSVSLNTVSSAITLLTESYFVNTSGAIPTDSANLSMSSTNGTIDATTSTIFSTVDLINVTDILSNDSSIGMIFPSNYTTPSMSTRNATALSVSPSTTVSITPTSFVQTMDLPNGTVSISSTDELRSVLSPTDSKSPSMIIPSTQSSSSHISIIPSPTPPSISGNYSALSTLLPSFSDFVNGSDSIHTSVEYSSVSQQFNTSERNTSYVGILSTPSDKLYTFTPELSPSISPFTLDSPITTLDHSYHQNQSLITTSVEIVPTAFGNSSVVIISSNTSYGNSLSASLTSQITPTGTLFINMSATIETPSFVSSVPSEYSSLLNITDVSRTLMPSTVQTNKSQHSPETFTEIFTESITVTPISSIHSTGTVGTTSIFDSTSVVSSALLPTSRHDIPSITSASITVASSPLLDSSTSPSASITAASSQLLDSSMSSPISPMISSFTPTDSLIPTESSEFPTSTSDSAILSQDVASSLDQFSSSASSDSVYLLSTTAPLIYITTTTFVAEPSTTLGRSSTNSKLTSDTYTLSTVDVSLSHLYPSTLDVSITISTNISDFLTILPSFSTNATNTSDWIMSTDYNTTTMNMSVTLSSSSIYSSSIEPTTEAPPGSSTANATNSKESKWVKTVLKVRKSVSVNSQAFKQEMEERLAQAYNEAFVREKLIKEGKFQPLEKRRRKKRYTTVGDAAVHIHEITRTDKTTSVSVAYSVEKAGVVMTADDAMTSLDVLDTQELAIILRQVVENKATPYIPGEEPVQPAEEESKFLFIMIIGGATVGAAVLIWIVCCIYCKCCRKKKIDDEDAEPELMSIQQEQMRKMSAHSPPMSKSLQKQHSKFNIKKVRSYETPVQDVPDTYHEEEKLIETPAQIDCRPALTVQSMTGSASPSVPLPKHELAPPEKSQGRRNSRNSIGPSMDGDEFHNSGGFRCDFAKHGDKSQLFQCSFTEDNPDIQDHFNEEKQKNKGRLRQKYGDINDQPLPQERTSILGMPSSHVPSLVIESGSPVDDIPLEHRRVSEPKIVNGIDENHGEENIVEARSRMHKLLDEAFSLISPRSSFTENNSKKPQETLDIMQGVEIEDEESSELPTASPAHLLAKEVSKTHESFINPAYASCYSEFLETWSPYRATEQVALISMPNSTSSTVTKFGQGSKNDRRQEVNKAASRRPATNLKIVNTNNTMLSETPYTTDPAKPIVIRTKEEDSPHKILESLSSAKLSDKNVKGRNYAVTGLNIEHVMTGSSSSLSKSRLKNDNVIEMQPVSRRGSESVSKNRKAGVYNETDKKEQSIERLNSHHGGSKGPETEDDINKKPIRRRNKKLNAKQRMSDIV